MADVKFFRVIGQHRGFTKDEKSDVDEYPQLKGISGGVTITARTSKNRAVLKAISLSPSPSLISLWPFEVKLDDGRLKVYADSEDPDYDQPDVLLVANCSALNLDEGEELIYQFKPHDVTANGQRQDLPSFSFVAPHIPDTHDDATDGTVAVDWTTVPWLENAASIPGGQIIEMVPDDVSLTVDGLVQFWANGTPLGPPLPLEVVAATVLWADIPGKPTFVAEGATAALARSAIEAAGSGELATGLNAKVDKNATPNSLYAVASNGTTQYNVAMRNGAEANSVPSRDANGTFVVGAPTASGHPVRKADADTYGKAISKVGYTGGASTVEYYEIARLPIDNNGNAASLSIQGRLGGWNNVQQASYVVTLANRTVGYTGVDITASVIAQGNLGSPGNPNSALGSADIEVWGQADKSAIVYLKVTAYYGFDLRASGTGYSGVVGTVNFVSAPVSAPTGTKIWSLSAAPRLEVDNAGRTNLSSLPAAGNWRIYGTDASGVPTSFAWTQSPTGSSVPVRDANGTFQVGAPTNANHPARKSDLDLKLDASQKGAASGVAPLDTNSRVPAANMPTSDAVTEGATNLYYTASRADARIAAARGVTIQAYNSILATIAALTLVNDNVLQVKSGAVTQRTPAQLKTDLALNNVDNTADANKPVSGPQQTALDAKQRKVIEGTTANGASATTKAVTSTVTPTAGDIVAVTFTNGNTATGISLNCNTTTAYPVALVGNTAVNAASLQVGTGGTVLFYFTGAQFQMLGVNAHLFLTTQAEVDAGTVTAPRLLSPQFLKTNLDTKPPKATGTPDGSKFLRDDNTWAVPPSGGGGGSGYDTYANMPAANTVPSGYLYRCSDIDSTYRSNAASWVQIDCGGGPVIGEPPTSGWTSVNIGTATVTNEKGTVLLTCPAVNGTVDTLRALSRPITGTPTITAKLEPHLTLANGPGMYFGFTDGTKFKFWALQMQGSQTLALLRQNWNTVTSISSTVNLSTAAPTAFLAQCKWWRIVDNGTNHVFSLSTNGLDWQVIDTISRTDFLTPNAFCVGMNTYGSGYTANMRVRQLAIT